MNLNTSILVIKNGVGELQFPQALKRDLFMSTISYQSLFIEANESTTHKGFLIVCDASFYIYQNGLIVGNNESVFFPHDSIISSKLKPYKFRHFLRIISAFLAILRSNYQSNLGVIKCFHSALCKNLLPFSLHSDPVCNGSCYSSVHTQNGVTAILC